MQTDRIRVERLMLTLSAILAVLVMVGALVVGWLRPAGLVDDSKIVADRKLGTVFVRVDGRLHPALNLVSAWLIAGEPSAPAFVSPDDLAKWPRGPLVGIEGAPPEPPAVLTPEVSRWAVCDTAADTISGRPHITGIDGQLTPGDRTRELGGDAALLGTFGGQAFVIANGVRMPVDLSDRAVTDPVGIAQGATAVQLSQAMVDAIPAGRPLVVPSVPLAGAPSAVALGVPVVNGAVVVSQDVASGRDQYYVVLPDGVQPVSSVVAAMLRQHDSFDTAEPARIPPDVLSNVAIRQSLDVSGYPAQPLKVVDWRANPVLCVAWERGADDRQARQRLLVGRALPVTPEQEAHVVPLVVADQDQGKSADQVLLADSPATWVSTTGASADSSRREALWLIGGSGARYGVPFDEAALEALGLKNVQPRLAPWPLLRVWPAGPELSKQAAMTMHDALAAPAAPLNEQGR